MKTEQLNMFAGRRMQMNESIDLTVASLNTYGPNFETWCFAWSGGKDSTTVLTLVLWLISSERVAAPKKIRVFYADTRLELTPLWFAAQRIMEELRELGIEVEVVMAPLEKRFMTYILGRGVPPPNNATFRWCTRQIKIDPMKAALEELHQQTGEKVLMITGVRQGESAIRDQRIVMSCSKDGAECGQGWYQQTMPESVCDTLAPILHWRVCHVWEWLKHWAPRPEFGDWSTEMIADAYGGDEAEEINARTGCMGCPLTEKDTALDNLLKREQYQFLKPLKGLRPIWRQLRSGKVRLRKTGKEKSAGKNKQRMGPLTIEARQWAFEQIKGIEAAINAKRPLNMPAISLINEEEEAHIRCCWENNVWPNQWNGDEPTGDVLMDQIYSDGTIQPILFSG